MLPDQDLKAPCCSIEWQGAFFDNNKAINCLKTNKYSILRK